MEQAFPKKSKRQITHRHQPIMDEVAYDSDASPCNRLRELEEAFRRSEERYHALAQATAQITWAMAPDGQVVEDIPFWRAYTGQSEAQVKGWGWLDAVHPDDHAHVSQDWQQAVVDKTMYETEYRTRGADGVYRFFLCVASLFLPRTVPCASGSAPAPILLNASLWKNS